MNNCELQIITENINKNLPKDSQPGAGSKVRRYIGTIQYRRTSVSDLQVADGTVRRGADGELGKVERDGFARGHTYREVTATVPEGEHI